MRKRQKWREIEVVKYKPSEGIGGCTTSGTLGNIKLTFLQRQVTTECNITTRMSRHTIAIVDVIMFVPRCCGALTAIYRVRLGRRGTAQQHHSGGPSREYMTIITVHQIIVINSSVVVSTVSVVFTADSCVY